MMIMMTMMTSESDLNSGSIEVEIVMMMMKWQLNGKSRTNSIQSRGPFSRFVAIKSHVAKCYSIAHKWQSRRRSTLKMFTICTVICIISTALGQCNINYAPAHIKRIDAVANRYQVFCTQCNVIETKVSSVNLVRWKEKLTRQTRHMK